MKRGFTVVEMLVVSAVAVGVLAGFFIFAVLALRVARVSAERQEAAAVAAEGIEVVRMLRDQGWDNRIASLSTSAAYYPVVQGGMWALDTVSPGPVHGLYDREVRLFEVLRDGSGTIGASGTADAATRRVQSRATWTRQGGTKEVVVETYLTNWRAFVE